MRRDRDSYLYRRSGGDAGGREPDDNRTDFDLGVLDSLAARVSFGRGSWSAHVSNAWLTWPEIAAPYDAAQTTASLSYFLGDQNRSLAWMAAFGQKREFHGSFEGYLLEGTLRRARHAIYSRAEWVIKDILDAGFHSIGIAHRHRPSPVGALTLGYVRALTRGRLDRNWWGRHRICRGGQSAGFIRIAVVVSRLRSIPGETGDFVATSRH